MVLCFQFFILKAGYSRGSANKANKINNLRIHHPQLKPQLFSTPNVIMSGNFAVTCRIYFAVTLRNCFDLMTFLTDVCYNVLNSCN